MQELLTMIDLQESFLPAEKAESNPKLRQLRNCYKERATKLEMQKITLQKTNTVASKLPTTSSWILTPSRQPGPYQSHQNHHHL